MATEPQVAAEVPATDYQTIPKPRAPRVSPEVQIAPTCMMWSIVIGMGILLFMVLLWAVPHLGTLDFGTLFR